MQVTYELTQGDFFDSLIAHRNRSLLAKWTFRGVVTIVFLLAGVGLLMAVFRPGSQTLASLAPLLGLAVLWGLLMWVSPWWMARSQFSKQPSAQGSRTLLLDAAGLHWRWDGGSADIEWKNIIRYVEAKKHFLLYSSPVYFNMVPKRVLTAEQVSEFRSLLVEHVSGAKRK